MPTPRIASLLAVGTVFVAFSMPVPHSAAAPRLEWPEIEAISVTRDTVWFCTQAQWDHPLNVAYSYIRTTREWRMATVARACPVRPMRMMSAWDVPSHVVTVAPGVRVEILDGSRQLIRVADEPRGRRITLAPRGLAALSFARAFRESRFRDQRGFRWRRAQ